MKIQIHWGDKLYDPSLTLEHEIKYFENNLYFFEYKGSRFLIQLKEKFCILWGREDFSGFPSVKEYSHKLEFPVSKI